MDLTERALEGALWVATHLAWLVGALAVLLAVTAAVIGPLVAWRAVAYRLHIHRVKRNTRRTAA